MKITWYGRSCMMLEYGSGTTVLCDPFSESVGYRLPDVEPDIVTVSHDHWDHNAAGKVRGRPKVIRTPGESGLKDIHIKGVLSGHYPEPGRADDKNIIFRITADNISLVHLGDTGRGLTEEQIQELKPCDILAVPVGGVVTVGSSGARNITKQLDPQMVIPVHYSTPSDRGRLDPVEKFSNMFIDVRYMKSWEGRRKDIPKSTAVFILMAQGAVDKDAPKIKEY